MKNRIRTNNSTFTKLKLSKKVKTPEVYNRIRSDIIQSNLKKTKSLNKSIINNHSYIPNQKILKILMNHQDTNLSNDKNNFITPLRNRICNYQAKTDLISKEITELRSETKTFIKRYNMSGLLTPKSNSHFLKLGLSKDVIKDINSEGYKVSDVINKTNIFDKSLLLNRQYAKFARNIIEEKNPELINDNFYISKMNETLNEKRNSDYFNYSNNFKERANVRKRTNLFGELLNKEETDKNQKVSILQLINQFNMIKKDIKMLSNKKILKERKKRIIRKKDFIKKALMDSKKLLIKLEGKTVEKNENVKDSSSIKDNEKANFMKRVRFNSVLIKNSNSLASTNLPNKQTDNENNNSNNKVSLPELHLNNEKAIINKKIKAPTIKNSSNDSLFGSFNFSNILNKEINVKREKNQRSFTNSFKLKRNNDKNKSKFNRNKLIDYFSLEELNSNPINKTMSNRNKEGIEKNDINVEEYKKHKNNALQNLYNNIQVKHFEENKKDISDYLQKYKGADVKEPDYEKGSKIYKLIKDFIVKNNDYNLPNEISKIRNRTNLFSYKRTKKFQDIIKMNNKIQNLIYDYAEDILDFNNDIRK